jgi:plasmid stabilization system protein ParE
MLTKHPRVGQPTILGQLRRIAATPFPYLLYYQVMNDEIVVIAVRHGAREPMAGP